MKILLVGEFSGVHNNLKKGLLELGHEVKLAADGDGYRGFEYDFPLIPYKKGKISILYNFFYLIKKLRKFTNYDIVQFIYPFSLPYYFFYLGIIPLIFLLNKKSIYYVCGTDPSFINSKNKFDYFPFDDIESNEYPKYNSLKLMYYNWFIRKIDLIIPSMYSYAVGYMNINKLSDPIPLPGSEYTALDNNREKGKIKILHGITRYNFKGSNYILNALERIKLEYSDRIEVKIIERIPFSEYQRVLEQADIVIDQCKCYDYGMNAIFSAEYGKVVLSGSEQVALDYLWVSNCPIINILPDSDDIYTELKRLLDKSPEEINSLKNITKKYIKEYHSNKNISSRFSNIYKNLITEIK